MNYKKELIKLEKIIENLMNEAENARLSFYPQILVKTYLSKYEKNNLLIYECLDSLRDHLSVIKNRKDIKKEEFEAIKNFVNVSIEIYVKKIKHIDDLK